MKIPKRVALAVCTVALVVGSTLAAVPAGASLYHPAVVSDNPADTTPHILFNNTSESIYAFEQIGNTIYAGGRFVQIQDPARTTTFARQNFVAFDRETGVVSPLNLAFNGMVTGIEASPDETALFVSGAFSTVNGITRRGIMKYDLVNDRIDPAFAPTGMRTVSDIKIANGSLIAVGNFSKHVMAMDLTTGADTGSINVTVGGVVDPTDETRVKKIAVSPNGTRLVATGNFATVNGQGRKRAFMLNLGPATTLSTWHAPRFDVDCAARSKLISAQGVDFSPDGSYFVVVSTGGPTGTSGVCDATARFETANVSANAQPTWINWTGGDTLYSVAVTGTAVYVGGHQRWLDNPYGSDYAGPGAVSRPGIGAINPSTGMALPWNPTKSREHGTMVLFATPQGLWVGSDGDRFGREDHAGIGFAPLDVGPAPDSTPPETVIESGPSGSVVDTSATFAFSANEPATFQCRIDGGPFAPCASPHSYADLALGSHTFQVAATDASSNVDATPAAQSWTVLAPSSDLIGNPGFEVNLAGWDGDGSANTLSRVTGGHSGGWAAQVSNSSAGGKCGIDDKPSWVSTTQDGVYTASIWVRSDAPGLTLRLRVREFVDGARQGTSTESIVLTSAWQQVSAEYTPVAPGLSLLDFEAYTSNAPAGVCFRADDASIALNLGPAPDTTPPETVIDSGPSGSVVETSATFAFSANEASTFECRLDGAPFAPCTSPVSFADVPLGSHIFQVAATDASSNVDATPAAQSWTVLAPSSELIGNPGFEVDLAGWDGDGSANTLSRVTGGHSGGWAAEVSNSSAGGKCGIDDKPSWVSTTQDGVYTASIWVRSDAPGLTLRLRVREFVDGARQGTSTESIVLTSAWQQVSAEYTPVAPGLSLLDFEAYTSNAPAGVCFRADDASIALNLGPAPDTTPPETVIDSGPSGSVVETSATFAFSANEASTFECRLDGAPFAPCASPVSFADLALGSHTFQVAATDASSNVDATPAERSWTVLDPSGDLIGNPGFEVDLAGWDGDASANTLSRVAGGHSGGWAVEVSNSSAGGKCGIDDKPSWVSTTQAGVYTASIWVKSDTPGLTLRLRVREFVNGVHQGTSSETIVLTSAWRQVTVEYTPVAPGSILDFEAYISNAPVGVCFQADDASITV